MALDTEDVDASEAQAAKDLPQPAGPAGPQVPKPRRPWLSAQERYEMGRSPGCDGCEALLITGAAARPHTPECWERITGILESTEAGRIKIARAQARMEQYQSIVANSVFSEIPIPAAAARWPADEDVADQESARKRTLPLMLLT